MAISEFREAINIDRNYAAAYKNTGDTFFDLKRYKDALSGYKSALNFNPLTLLCITAWGTYIIFWDCMMTL